MGRSLVFTRPSPRVGHTIQGEGLGAELTDSEIKPSCQVKLSQVKSNHVKSNQVKRHKRLKRMLFIRTKHNMQIVGVIPLFKLKIAINSVLCNYYVSILF